MEFCYNWKIIPLLDTIGDQIKKKKVQCPDRLSLFKLLVSEIPQTSKYYMLLLLILVITHNLMVIPCF